MTSIPEQIESFYHQIFADGIVDDSESSQVAEFFAGLEIPPEKLVWIRASAFRIASDYLSEEDIEANVHLLKSINQVVHVLETTLMEPKETESEDELDADELNELLGQVYTDVSIDQSEATQVREYFSNFNPSPGNLIDVRATALRKAAEFLGDDKAHNIELLRSINQIVHIIESCYMKPKDEICIENFSVDITLQDAAKVMWDLDGNRCVPQKDYQLNPQCGKDAYDKDDVAHEPLFTWVDPNVFNIKTFQLFIKLLDNYKQHTGDAEEVTDEEVSEIHAFLAAIMETPVMKFCHRYCSANGVDVPEDEGGFAELLYQIWFGLYSREDGQLDTSGFEHVFLGEKKGGKVTGFHSWIRYYFEEIEGAVNYKGYILPRKRSGVLASSDDHLFTFNMTWDGLTKFITSIFIGTSPEFEFALLSMFFLCGNEKDDFEIDTGSDVFTAVAKCFTWNHAGGKYIATAYIEMLDHD